MYILSQASRKIYHHVHTSLQWKQLNCRVQRMPSSKVASAASSPMLVPAIYPPDHAFYKKNN
jgi:hypothetical protein